MTQLDYKLASRIIIFCMGIFLSVSIVLISLMPRIEPASAAPKDEISTIDRDKPIIISLFKYTHKQDLSGFERAIWDAFFLGDSEQRKQLGKAFGGEQFAFNSYSLAQDNEAWFANRGIIIMPLESMPVANLSAIDVTKK